MLQSKSIYLRSKFTLKYEEIKCRLKTIIFGYLSSFESDLQETTKKFVGKNADIFDSFRQTFSEARKQLEECEILNN